MHLNCLCLHQFVTQFASLDCSKPVLDHLHSLFFICVKADWCSGPQLKGTLLFANFLMGFTISDNLAKSLDK